MKSALTEDPAYVSAPPSLRQSRRDYNRIACCKRRAANRACCTDNKPRTALPCCRTENNTPAAPQAVPAAQRGPPDRSPQANPAPGLHFKTHGPVS
jgi:hypothetical protein